eukprot:GHUV01012028.1.p2 GENE.GHUV01012028.1~~GHUV01012028.1.p2  ORF type:complete len:112 (+),score=39.70 GHUV01012028.1:752-1087(+)
MIDDERQQGITCLAMWYALLCLLAANALLAPAAAGLLPCLVLLLLSTLCLTVAACAAVCLLLAGFVEYDVSQGAALAAIAKTACNSSIVLVVRQAMPDARCAFLHLRVSVV